MLLLGLDRCPSTRQDICDIKNIISIKELKGRVYVTFVLCIFTQGDISIVQWKKIDPISSSISV